MEGGSDPGPGAKVLFGASTLHPPTAPGELRTILNDLTGVTRDNRDPVRYTRVLSV